MHLLFLFVYLITVHQIFDGGDPQLHDPLPVIGLNVNRMISVVFLGQRKDIVIRVVKRQEDLDIQIQQFFQTVQIALRQIEGQPLFLQLRLSEPVLPSPP